jgi:hypothetical protein
MDVYMPALPNVTSPFPALLFIPNSERLCLLRVYMFGSSCLWVVLRHGLGTSSSHTPEFMNLVPVLLTLHSTLYNRYPLHTKATY